MRTNNIDAIKEHEGLRLVAYLDSVGVWTIGYGDTGPDVVKGLTITKEEAEKRLRRRLVEFEGYVNTYVKVPLKQHQFDALVSLVYNIGPTNFKTSTLLKKLNAGDYIGAADQFLVWNKGRVDGKLVVIKGLANRRAKERKQFLGE
ncbi:putative endolysin [Pseudomonas phage K4]|uniref:endolysin n=1 Tax=Pseudomonas phage O4 TaxID=1784982 RepID=UPI00078CCB9C|nr:endolysin [Pseudomonas phage O4]AMO43495.1 putative endolysin [Pseudomonas phage O4]QWS70007.1 putative endolysin [Pseudomonas phage K4]